MQKKRRISEITDTGHIKKSSHGIREQKRAWAKSGLGSDQGRGPGRKKQKNVIIGRGEGWGGLRSRDEKKK